MGWQKAGGRGESIMTGRIVLLALCLCALLPAVDAEEDTGTVDAGYKGCHPEYTSCANCCDINPDCICDGICFFGDAVTAATTGLGCSYRPPQNEVEMGTCDAGYKKCPACCDINPDCMCNQICPGASAPKGCSYIPRPTFGEVLVEWHTNASTASSISRTDTLASSGAGSEVRVVSGSACPQSCSPHPPPSLRSSNSSIRIQQDREHVLTPNHSRTSLSPPLLMTT